jgi:hypothetical protein
LTIRLAGATATPAIDARRRLPRRRSKSSVFCRSHRYGFASMLVDGGDGGR